MNNISNISVEKQLICVTMCYLVSYCRFVKTYLASLSPLTSVQLLNHISIKLIKCFYLKTSLLSPRTSFPVILCILERDGISIS